MFPKSECIHHRKNRTFVVFLKLYALFIMLLWIAYGVWRQLFHAQGLYHLIRERIVATELDFKAGDLRVAKSLQLCLLVYSSSQTTTHFPTDNFRVNSSPSLSAVSGEWLNLSLLLFLIYELEIVVTTQVILYMKCFSQYLLPN